MDRYGAYLSHMIQLTEDSAVKSVDKQKLNVYVKNWCEARVLIGCAFFRDLLTLFFA